MLFRNTVAQTAGVVVGYLFSFLLAPLMLSRLGLDKFGVWAVTGAFATYAGLLDLGVGRSLIRFVAVFEAEEDALSIRRSLGLGLLSVTAVGLVALAVVASLAQPISAQFGVLDGDEMRWVLLASVAIYSFNGYSGVFNALGIGSRRMVPPNVAIVIGACLNFSISVVTLLLTRSLVAYAAANAVAAALSMVPTYIAMRKIRRGPYFALPTRSLARRILSFSVKDQIGWIADLVNFQTDKIIIAFAVDVRAAAIYEIASRVVLGVRGIAIMTVSAMIPTAAAAIAAEGRGVVRDMYRRYTLRSCAVAFPLFVVCSATSPFLLIFWLSKAPGDSELLVPFLTLAYMFNLTTGVGSTISLAAGHPGVVSLNSVLIAILNLAFTLALAPLFGIWGVVGGTFAALLLGSLWFNWRFIRLFRLRAADFIFGVLPTGVLALALAIPSTVLSLVIGSPSGRLPAAFWLAIGSTLYLLPYWILATRWDMLPAKMRLPVDVSGLGRKARA